MLRVFGAILGFAALAGCAAVPQQTGSDMIGPGYAVGGGEWSSGGGITAVARVFGEDGQTIVCGAWMTDKQSALSAYYNEDVMQGAAVFAGDTRVIRNLIFMPRVPYQENLTGTPAGCTVSDVPWSPALAQVPTRLRFPRMTFSGGSGIGIGVGIGIGGIGGGFSGDTVSFRETPRPNPLR